MPKKRQRLEIDWEWLKAWFDLAPGERGFLAGVLAIALVGLVARYLHLRHETPQPYSPAGIEQAANGVTP
jgi:hypothetical protein